jgi:hypothetical protein
MFTLGLAHGQEPPFATAGLRLERVIVYKRIASFPSNKGDTRVRISANGDKVAVSSVQGTFVLNANVPNADATEIKTLGKDRSHHVEISADARTVAWYAKNEIHVCGSDGGGLKTKKLDNVRALRLTTNGDRVIAMTGDGAIHRLDVTGGALGAPQLLTDVKRIGAVLGDKDLNGNRVHDMEISDSGNDIILGCDPGNVSGKGAAYVLKMDGKGGGLHVLAQFARTDGNLRWERLSADGKKVACHLVTNAQQKSVRLVLINEQGEKQFLPYANVDGGGSEMVFARDGSRVAVGNYERLITFATDRKEALDATFPGPPLYEPVSYSVSADGKRFCLLVNNWQGRQDVVVIDLYAGPNGLPKAQPAKAPTLDSLHLSARLFVEGWPVDVSARSDGKGVVVWAVLMRDGLPLEGNRRVFLNKQTGKETAGAPTATFAAPVQFMPDKTFAAGPLTLRVLAVDEKRGHATCFDVAGVRAFLSLTGTWAADDGGTYHLRQLGATVWWLGRSKDDGRAWTQVFRGTINDDDELVGDWSYVPEGARQGTGTLTLRLVVQEGRTVEMQKKGQAGDPTTTQRWTPTK